MGRKRNEIGCGGILFGILLIYSITTEYPEWILGTMILLISGIFVYIQLNEYFLKKKRHALHQQITNFFQKNPKYEKILHSKYERLVYQDEYDEYIYYDYHKAINDFMNRILLKYIPTIERDIDISKNVLLDILEKNRPNYDLQPRRLDLLTKQDVSPIDFEYLVRKEFKKQSWTARVTKGSGDQGADVIARKNNFTVIVQCKMYNNSVGNKAVQEVAAAREYYDGDLAVVIATNKFTKSARQLSHKLQVDLVHFDDLPEWLSKLKTPHI